MITWGTWESHDMENMKYEKNVNMKYEEKKKKRREREREPNTSLTKILFLNIKLSSFNIENKITLALIITI